MTKVAEVKPSTPASKATTLFFNKGAEGALSSAETEQAFFVKKKESSAIQAKLTIGQPNDRYEKEADSVADKVVQRMSLSENSGAAEAVRTGSQTPVITPYVQTKCEQCEREKKLQKQEDEHVQESPDMQRKPIFDSTAELNEEKNIQRTCTACGEKEKIQRQSETTGTEPESNVEKNLEASKGGGSPLPPATRAKMENAIGADFSNVRVHTDSSAVKMNKDLGAHAFAHGSDIYFNSGKYDPDTKEGNHLLAHELTHTVQQGGSAVKQKKQDEVTELPVEKTDQPQIQGAWYNFSIPFTDYEFDPSLEGVKTAAGIVVDKAKEGLEWIYDQIKDLVNSGISWLQEQWESIQSFVSTAWNTLKEQFGKILTFIKRPLNAIMNAIMNMDGESLNMLWLGFSTFVTSTWKGFKALTDKLLHSINSVWKGISGFATSLIDKVYGLTENFIFKKLPDTLQNLAYGLINQLKSIWKSIDDGWNKIFGKVKKWIDGALDEVLQFVLKISSFAINGIVKGILYFGKLVLFLKDLFTNPQKYLNILAKKSVAAFDGLESRFSGIVSTYFSKDEKSGSSKAAGKIQKAPDPQAGAEVKGSASWSEIGSGIWTMMGKKWEEFKKNPWSIVTDLLLDMFVPIYGNVKDVIHLFKEIWAIVTGPLGASSLEEVWTSFLKLLDIPILIYHTVVSILMRSLMVPLIVASFIKHPLVIAIASAVGYGLLGMFVESELANIGHKILLLKTGATNKKEKEAAYNRVADSLIALAMTGVIIVIMLILHFIANIMKGIYNFIKGKVVGIEAKPVEVKGGSGEGKGTGEGKGSGEGKVNEPPKLKGEMGSTDGQRSIKVTEKGKIWICASPCEEIRFKYDAQIKENPKFEERIKTLEEGYADLTPEQKAARDGQIKQLEQELQDIKVKQEGGVRPAKEVKWPPEPPQGEKPAYDAPNAAEWRYQRYVYEKYVKGVPKEKILPPDEWMRRHFNPASKGGRPGRPGGPEQVAAKKELASKGIEIVEDVELGGRYPDGVDPVPNAAGGTNYYEVGEMLKNGIPEARERVKIADEINAMKPNDNIIFVDKTNVNNKAIYGKGSTPDNPTSRTFTPEKE